MADFMVVHSSYSGFVAYRNPDKGSYFIVTLVDVLKEKAQYDHLADMVTEVIKKISSMRMCGNEKQVCHNSSPPFNLNYTLIQ